MKPFFSIIVPCCDVEPYVRECFDSVLSQPFGDWEMLVGVEESKDKTEEIVREYAAKDARIKVFTGPRSGSCSASRNTGIDMATGEYVIFLDGDDTITEGSLQRLHDKIAERPGADIYPCAMKVYDENTGKNEPDRDNYPGSCNGVLTGPDATLLAMQYCSDFCQMMQLSVFRREYLLSKGLKCIYGLRRQDSEFSPRALYLADTVLPIHEPFYKYRIRKGSVSSHSRSIGHFSKDWAIILKSRFRFFAMLAKTANFDRRLARIWANDWISILYFKWFSKKFVAEIARSKRLETLKIIFSEGFNDFYVVLQAVSPYKRIAAWWVVFFLKHPRTGWMAECFFTCVFYPFSKFKDWV